MKSHMTTADKTSRTFGITFICMGIVLFAAIAPFAQQLRQGVSVQMARTTNAKPMPEADDQDAWVVAVTADGKLFFGTEALSDQGLVDLMTRTPRRRDQNIYIKADGRTAYANVEMALQAAHVVKFDQPILLTSQPESNPPGKVAPPRGLAVSLESNVPTERPAVSVEIRATQGTPTLSVNAQEIPWEDLSRVLTQLFQGQSRNVVQLEADGSVPFAYLARATDACSAQARVILVGTTTI
jgi:biopolymer transport protein ExbD